MTIQAKHWNKRKADSQINDTCWQKSTVNGKLSPRMCTQAPTLIAVSLPEPKPSSSEAWRRRRWFCPQTWLQHHQSRHQWSSWRRGEHQTGHSSRAPAAGKGRSLCWWGGCTECALQAESERDRKKEKKKKNVLAYKRAPVGRYMSREINRLQDHTS